MTSRERVYDYVIGFMTEHLYAPSIREICEGTGLKSTSSVYHHLINLELDGKLKCEGVRQIKPRGYSLCKEDTEK